MDTLILLAFIMLAILVPALISVMFFYAKAIKRLIVIAREIKKETQSLEEKSKDIHSMLSHISNNRELIDPLEFVFMMETVQDRIDQVASNEDYEMAAEMKKSMDLLIKEFSKNNPNVSFKQIKTKPYNDEE